MSQEIDQESNQIAGAALLLLACCALVAHALYFNFLNDDAFISFRYADNLVRHGELVFNLGERVEGYTNFLWTILMAGVMGLGLDVGVWSRVLSVGCAIGTMGVLARFSAQLAGRRTWSDAVPALLLAAAPAYACWSTGGLETQLFTLLLALGWTSYLDAIFRNERALYRCAIWLGLAAMARPEGMLVFGLLGLYHVFWMLSVERRWKPKGSEYLCAATFLAVFGPYFAWRWSYYGWPFPNTYYVKTGAANFWAPGTRYALSWVNDHLLWLFPLLAIAAFKGLKKAHRPVVYLGVFLSIIYILHVMRVGGDFMGLHRFLVPVMPLLAMIAAVGLRWLYEVAREKKRWRLPLLGLGLGLLVFSAVHISRVDQKAMTVGSDHGVDRIGWLKMFHGQCEAIGRWLQINAPSDASIATTAAGIIPYYSRLYTVDVLGLNDEWIAHNVKAHGNRPGHTKSAPLSYVLQKQVDYLIYHPTISDTQPRRSLRDKKTWRTRGYEWKTVEVPGLIPPWWGFWQMVREPLTGER
jgi:arabinofuranosyltransferase